MSILSFFKRNTQAKPVDYDIGVIITSTTQSRRDATAQACLDLICGAFADLSGHVFNSATKKREVAHPIDILMREPNLDETRFLFMYGSALDYFNGNVYWLKARGSDGEMISLFRLDPSKMRVSRSDLTNLKVYTYKGNEYSHEEIVHIPSRFGYNGLVGRSIFQEFSQIFQVSSEIDEFVNNSFNNSLGKRAVIDISKKFKDATPAQIEALREKYRAEYSGSKNAGKPFVKADQIEISAIDTGASDNRASQLIENREFQEKEIAKLFGVPLSFLKGENKYGDIETLFTVFLQNSIKPLSSSFEQSINKQFSPYERELYYFEFDYNGLMKTSLSSRIDAYTKQFNNGILSVNEIRERENLKPIAGRAGGTNFVPSNLMPLRDDVVDAYMASSKAKIQGVENVNDDTAHSPNGIGDDKL